MSGSKGRREDDAGKSAGTRGYGLLEGFLAKKRAHQVFRLLPPSHGKSIALDIGCGRHPVFLMQASFREKYGIDQTIEAPEAEKYAALGIKLFARNVDDAGGLPFEDETFDVVTMLAVLEHLAPSSLNPLLKEIMRVLRRGGLFILTTPAPWTENLLSLLAAVRLVSPVEIAEHKGSYGPAVIARLLAGAGFLPENIATGYFELGMNVWARAGK